MSFSSEPDPWTEVTCLLDPKLFPLGPIPDTHIDRLISRNTNHRFLFRTGPLLYRPLSHSGERSYSSNAGDGKGVWVGGLFLAIVGFGGYWLGSSHTVKSMFSPFVNTFSTAYNQAAYEKILLHGILDPATKYNITRDDALLRRLDLTLADGTEVEKSRASLLRVGTNSWTAGDRMLVLYIPEGGTLCNPVHERLGLLAQGLLNGGDLSDTIDFYTITKVATHVGKMWLSVGGHRQVRR
ncbi:hypothetical protein MMC13_006689 [Lambiella insularis]|nr:hypothetical protein [Lambiella insularis]